MATLNTRDLEVMTIFAGMVTDAINNRISEEESTVKAIDSLHDVIVDQDFQIFLQPIVHLATDKIEGAEALCRFRPTPYRSPDKWFDQAEKVGLRLELELATVRKSLSMLPHMPANQYLSINASASMARAPELLALLDGPRANRIVLELTDHQNIPDLEALLKSFKQIRALGVRIAVDDFAPTHDAFATMMRIKPDILKMDRSLVRGVHLDIPNQALIMSLVHFAAAINATLLGEGIEITAEHKCLQTLGIKSGQGFLIGTPELMSTHQDLLGQVRNHTRH